MGRTLTTDESVSTEGTASCVAHEEDECPARTMSALSHGERHDDLLVDVANVHLVLEREHIEDHAVARGRCGATAPRGEEEELLLTTTTL